MDWHEELQNMCFNVIFMPEIMFETAEDVEFDFGIIRLYHTKLNNLFVTTVDCLDDVSCEIVAYDGVSRTRYEYDAGKFEKIYKKICVKR